MDFWTRTLEIIQRVEADLRSELAKAAAAGEYAAVIRITQVAQDVSSIAVRHSGAVIEASRADGSQMTPTVPAPTPSAQVTLRKRARAQYPKFLRQGDRLIRVAWSKNDNKEYEHRAPLGIVPAIANAIVRVGKEGRVFTADQIAPLKNNDGADFPSYQLYAAIGFLKHADLIEQHGRQGYSIVRQTDLRQDANSALANLKEK